MRVNSSTSPAVQGAETAPAKKTDRTKQTEEASKKGGASRLSSGAAESTRADISTKGKEYARVKAAASEAPDIREGKVKELKERIAAGKYKVDAEAVADRLVDEHLSTASA